MTTNAVSVITSRNVVLRSLRQHMAGVFCFFDSQSFNTTFDRRARARPAPCSARCSKVTARRRSGCCWCL